MGVTISRSIRISSSGQRAGRSGWRISTKAVLVAPAPEPFRNAGRSACSTAFGAAPRGEYWLVVTGITSACGTHWQREPYLPAAVVIRSMATSPHAPMQHCASGAYYRPRRAVRRIG